jgi:hypothetical protein
MNYSVSNSFGGNVLTEPLASNRLPLFQLSGVMSQYVSRGNVRDKITLKNKCNWYDIIKMDPNVS